jgi:hypothetical protein
MNFWKINKKMVLSLCGTIAAGCFAIIYFAADFGKGWIAFLFASGLSAFALLNSFILFIVPALNSFRVIRRLTEDTSAFAVTPLFDDGYMIGTRYEKSWFFFTTPCINASISSLPVTIYYEPSSRSNPSYITFRFQPLAKDGSKRIYSEWITFTLRFRKRLSTDIKPQVLQFTAGLKEKGLTSGAHKPVSTKHYEQYED